MNSTEEYILTKKNRTKYEFVTESKEQHPHPIQDSKLTYFYQICTFPNPNKKDKFHMRKFVLNENNEFISINNFFLSNKQCKRFFSAKKPNEYKCYPVYNLEDIGYPTNTDILTCQSEILSNAYEYSGFAPFK